MRILNISSIQARGDITLAKLIFPPVTFPVVTRPLPEGDGTSEQGADSAWGWTGQQGKKTHTPRWNIKWHKINIFLRKRREEILVWPGRQA